MTDASVCSNPSPDQKRTPRLWDSRKNTPMELRAGPWPHPAGNRGIPHPSGLATCGHRLPQPHLIKLM